MGFAYLGKEDCSGLDIRSDCYDRTDRTRDQGLTAPIPALAPVTSTVLPTKRVALNTDMFWVGEWMGLGDDLVSLI